MVAMSAQSARMVTESGRPKAAELCVRLDSISI
jgi:hypothetical protein